MWLWLRLVCCRSWRTGLNQFVDCRPDYACQGGDNGTINGFDQCSAAFTGERCGLCRHGYYRCVRGCHVVDCLSYLLQAPAAAARVAADRGPVAFACRLNGLCPRCPANAWLLPLSLAIVAVLALVAAVYFNRKKLNIAGLSIGVRTDPCTAARGVTSEETRVGCFYCCTGRLTSCKPWQCFRRSISAGRRSFKVERACHGAKSGTPAHWSLLRAPNHSVLVPPVTVIVSAH